MGNCSETVALFADTKTGGSYVYIYTGRRKYYSNWKNRK